ncbi:MAG: single-stranded DNA-binding protein [Chloroflexota bacterium]|nr:MAG: single-stranded DNA-binding protein [Chloroflexota bacterium]
MAKDLNKVMLTGYLGADPEMRYTPQGSAVTTFRVASGRTWKSADGTQHDDTEWFRIVAWEKLAEICNQYLSKGTRVYIEGRLQTRKWQDQNGQDRYTTEVIAQDMIILSPRGERQAVPADVDSDEDLAAPAPTAAPSRRSMPNGPARPAANGNTSRSVGGRAPSRNVPQAIESDEDLPF